MPSCDGITAPIVINLCSNVLTIITAFVFVYGHRRQVQQLFDQFVYSRRSSVSPIDPEAPTFRRQKQPDFSRPGSGFITTPATSPVDEAPPIPHPRERRKTQEIEVDVESSLSSTDLHAACVQPSTRLQQYMMTSSTSAMSASVASTEVVDEVTKHDDVIHKMSDHDRQWNKEDEKEVKSGPNDVINPYDVTLETVIKPYDFPPATVIDMPERYDVTPDVFNDVVDVTPEVSHDHHDVTPEVSYDHYDVTLEVPRGHHDVTSTVSHDHYDVTPEVVVTAQDIAPEVVNNVHYDIPPTIIDFDNDVFMTSSPSNYSLDLLIYSPDIPYLPLTTTTTTTTPEVVADVILPPVTSSNYNLELLELTPDVPYHPFVVEIHDDVITTQPEVVVITTPQQNTDDVTESNSDVISHFGHDDVISPPHDVIDHRKSETAFPSVTSSDYILELLEKATELEHVPIVYDVTTPLIVIDDVTDRKAEDVPQNIYDVINPAEVTHDVTSKDKDNSYVVFSTSRDVISTFHDVNHDITSTSFDVTSENRDVFTHDVSPVSHDVTHDVIPAPHDVTHDATSTFHDVTYSSEGFITTYLVGDRPIREVTSYTHTELHNNNNRDVIPDYVELARGDDYILFDTQPPVVLPTSIQQPVADMQPPAASGEYDNFKIQDSYDVFNNSELTDMKREEETLQKATPSYVHELTERNEEIRRLQREEEIRRELEKERDEEMEREEEARREKGKEERIEEEKERKIEKGVSYVDFKEPDITTVIQNIENNKNNDDDEGYDPFKPFDLPTTTTTEVSYPISTVTSTHTRFSWHSTILDEIRAKRSIFAGNSPLISPEGFLGLDPEFLDTVSSISMTPSDHDSWIDLGFQNAYFDELLKYQEETRVKPQQDPQIEVVHDLSSVKQVARIDRDDVIFSDVILGEGKFGVVVQGLYKSNDINTGKEVYVEVAIKRIKEENIVYKNELLHEMDMIERVGEHDHIVKMIGHVEHAHDPFIVFEFYTNGQLLKYLSMQMEADTPNLLRIASEVCSALVHLSSKHIIHRDIAARNIFLDGNFSAKLGDFGLSQQLVAEKDYTFVPTDTEKLPVPWMARESLRDRVFTVKTDVWSFGMLLFEMFSLGKRPFDDVDTSTLKDGYLEHPERRPPCPDRCSSHVYSLMRLCWDQDAEDRPDFSKISSILSSLQSSTLSD